MSPPRPRHHILVVHVENKAGVLTRVAGLFSRRGYNIYSLTVAPTPDPRFSRITIAVDVESAPLDQIVAQLDKLINVTHIANIDPDLVLERELLLVTVPATPAHRSQILELVSIYAGEVVNVTQSHLSLMIAGHPDTLDAFESLITPYGPTDLQRSGRVALARLPHPT
jgi:acetolactate synthase-1/3 small subunit